ncbi:MAG: cell division topological specificity factor MinE [Chloroflexi bacterium]|nr:cell division topological specificity factor MinE [Chloroflexota bacterium]
MSFINRLFGRSPDSAHVAKERLQLVLAHDRTSISPETLDLLKDEIISVISKHIEIDRAHVEVSISRGAQGNRLVADIPVVGVRGGRRAPREAR